MENVIETAGLTRRFGSVLAVNGIDFTVRRGEMFGVVGPDGAGKTTLIRLLCGILAPSAGRAMVLGHDIEKEPDKVKRGIGYLSQRFSLYADLSVDENIEFFAGINGVTDLLRRRNDLLDFTRLTPFRARLAGQLSGGMKQKLALVCTLIHTPSILFLDEPTTGVDPVSRRDFWRILQSLLAEGITIGVGDQRAAAVYAASNPQRSDRDHRRGSVRDPSSARGGRLQRGLRGGS